MIDIHIFRPAKKWMELKWLVLGAMVVVMQSTKPVANLLFTRHRGHGNSMKNKRWFRLNWKSRLHIASEKETVLPAVPAETLAKIQSNFILLREWQRHRWGSVWTVNEVPGQDSYFQDWILTESAFHVGRFHHCLIPISNLLIQSIQEAQ